MFLTQEQNEKRTTQQLFSQRYMMNPLFHSNKNGTAFENYLAKLMVIDGRMINIHSASQRTTILILG